MAQPIQIPRTKKPRQRGVRRPSVVRVKPVAKPSGCCGRGLGGGKTLVPKK